jgi:hypothetical protein
MVNVLTYHQTANTRRSEQSLVTCEGKKIDFACSYIDWYPACGLGGIDQQQRSGGMGHL